MVEIRTVQINVRKSKIASCELNRKDQDVALISEPYLFKGNVALIESNVGNLYYAPESYPRACIRINENLNPWLVNEFTSRDICCVAANVEGRLTFIASVYLDINLSATPDQLSHLIDSCNRKGIPLLLGIDTNAHSALWGCSEGNARGSELEALIAERNLTVMNEGRVPTFKTVRAESIIDVTLTNSAFYQTMSLTDWKVNLEESSFSDHCYINYQWGSYVPIDRKYRNLKKANWQLFKELTSNKSLPEVLADGSNLDACVGGLTELIDNTLNEACPMRTALERKPNSWWTKELANLRIF